MKTEQLNKDNWKEFIQLHKESVIYHQKFDEEKYQYDKSIPKDFEKFFKQNNTKCLLTKAEGKYNGFIILWIQDNIGTICEIFVKAQIRGKGIGKKLMDAGIDWFKERNIKRINVKVDARNEATIRFYSKYGFQSEDIVMRKEI